MTIKSLSIIALLLACLIVVVIYVGADRLGYLEPIDAIELYFENPLLKAKKGQTVVVRPMVSDGDLPVIRIQTYRFDMSPDPDPRRALDKDPHLIVARSHRRANQEHFGTAVPGPVLLSLLGALDSQNWLEQLELVNEIDPDGRSRRVICASFFHPNGTYHRFFHDPKNPVLPIGWHRLVVRRPDGASEVYLAEAQPAD